MQPPTASSSTWLDVDEEHVVGSTQHTTPISADETAMLWSTHCDSILAGAVRYQDQLVDDMWHLFAPLVGQVQLTACEDGQADAASPSRSGLTGSEEDGGALSATHVFALDVGGGLETSQRRQHPHGPTAQILTPAMRAALVEQPVIVLALVEFFVAVMHLSRTGKEKKGAKLVRVRCLPRAEAGHASPFDALGAAQLGRLVIVRGTIIRLSPTRVSCLHMTYRCGLCGAAQEAAAEDGVLVYPGPCAGPRCRGYKWQPCPSQSRCEEVQLLKLQEHTESVDLSAPNAGGGGMTKVVEVELRRPLLDRVTVGDTAIIVGVLGTRRGTQKASSAQALCLRAFSIETLGQAQSPLGRTGPGATAREEVWSMEECGQFYEMARQPNWFSRMCASVAPSIFGVDYVKEALLLSVVGGSAMKTVGASRSSIHVLMVGDPGLGKSQLLRAAAQLSHRSAFVCAHTSSSCGLTMTLSRDPVTGEATFEAGAVVHGDGGVTCIDEIDKSGQEHKALLEVMEQETISIAKAGMVFSMPVRTSILAAGNPQGGRWDPLKSIPDNLRLSPALLSRFDLVICLRDDASLNSAAANASRQSHHDGNNLTHHILQLHRHRPESTDAHTSPLPTTLVRRFTHYCRTQCHPVLSPDARAVLKAHYLTERQRMTADGASGGAVTAVRAITLRYLQALMRVAEARAKVELRHEVSREDAEYAVQLMQRCLGSMQPQGQGGGASVRGEGAPRTRSARDKAMQLLRTLSTQTDRNLLTRQQVLTACEEAGSKQPSSLLHQLNEFGLLLMSGDKFRIA